MLSLYQVSEVLLACLFKFFLLAPILVFQDGSRNTGLPPLDPSLGEFDISSLQVRHEIVVFARVTCVGRLVHEMCCYCTLNGSQMVI